MIQYKLEKISDFHYNLFFGAEKHYTMTFNDAITLIAHKQTQSEFEETTLKEYLIQFYKNWRLIKDENSRT